MSFEIQEIRFSLKESSESRTRPESANRGRFEIPFSSSLRIWRFFPISENISSRNSITLLLRSSSVTWYRLRWTASWVENFVKFHKIVRQNFGYWLKYRFLAKISIFGKNWISWRTFQFLAKISIFGQNFNFWRKFQFLAKISLFGENFNFCRKLRSLEKNFETKIFLFFNQKRIFVSKIFNFSWKSFESVVWKI